MESIDLVILNVVESYAVDRGVVGTCAVATRTNESVRVLKKKLLDQRLFIEAYHLSFR